MDRLVCGDVGFGKTEVALRAAFVAVAGGKQVAVLVPTTLLAEQHFQTLRRPLRRLAGARSPSCRASAPPRRSTQALEGARRRHDRHRHRHAQAAASSDVKFKQPGPGHHRRGAPLRRAPEGGAEGAARRGRRAHAHRHADPAHARHVARRPARFLGDRHRAAAAPRDQDLRRALSAAASIREAVLRELKRGGQVYFLHNEVETIENMRDEAGRRCCPRRASRVAHGQMRERELERVMRDFYHAALQPAAVLDHHRDRHRRARPPTPSSSTAPTSSAWRSCTSCAAASAARTTRPTPTCSRRPTEALTAQAKKRLEAIQMMEELGSGFYLAMHDLEIRGAGEVLGESQSGEMQEVGFPLYNDMLEHAVRSLKAGREPDLRAAARRRHRDQPARAGAAARRLLRRRARAAGALQAPGQLRDARRSSTRCSEELIDRFGLLPEPAQALLECHRLRIRGAPLGVARDRRDAEAIAAAVRRPSPPVDAREDASRWCKGEPRPAALPGPGPRCGIEAKHAPTGASARRPCAQLLRELAA